MNRTLLILFAFCLCWVVLGAQTHRNPPDFTISVAPTSVMFSWYDYMIGGYNASPVINIPDALGGGALMAYHAQMQNSNTRLSYLAYVNPLGELQYLDTLSVNGAYNGYPSLDLDEESNTAFVAWHNQLGDNDNYSVYGSFCLFSGGSYVAHSIPMPIFDSASPGESYLWPIVKIGASPFQGMRRIYVMARKPVTTVYPAEVPKIAYADFIPSQVDYNTILTWNYISVPEIESWASNTEIYRRPYYTMLVGNNGNLYLCGHHTSRDAVTDIDIDEPNLDVFTFIGTNPDNWNRHSIYAEQNPSCQLTTDYDVATNISNSGHFNAVVIDDGKILFPQLSTFEAWEDNVFYTFPALYSMRQVVYDTVTETFRIDDLYPQGASPHAEPAYTPWDINEDGQIDEIDDEGNPVFPTIWPFPHWDNTTASGAMMFSYNLQLMTEPNEDGWMACVWEDSSSEPPNALSPDIAISLSPDNGYSWLEPVFLNPVEQPMLSGMIPMWVYPANKILMLSYSDSTAIGRLYLMLYDDNQWGAEAGTAIITWHGGYVNYMAIDFTLPLTSNNDPVIPTPVITLEQNYPNPFTGTTSIKYSLAGDSEITLGIYNVKGQLIKALAKGKAKAGEHSIEWNGEDNQGRKVSTGLYFYKLETGDKTLSKKLLLLR